MLARKSFCVPAARCVAAPRQSLVVSAEKKAKNVNPRVVSRRKRHERIRRKLSGTPEKPRLCVFRSHEHIYAQVIDDTLGHTLVGMSTLTPLIREELKEQGINAANVTASKNLGLKVAAACKEKNISTVAFDRAGYKFHGRVAAVAEGAREGGLDF